MSVGFFLRGIFLFNPAQVYAAKKATLSARCGAYLRAECVNMAADLVRCVAV